MPVTRLGAVTAESHFNTLTDGRVSTLQDSATFGWLAKMATLKRVTLPPITDINTDIAPLKGFLHTDRWLVGCPCRQDFQFVWVNTPLYMCTSCWNADAGGRWRPVQMPDDRDAIEAAMGDRSRPEERNWLPGETDEHLIRETASPDSGTRIRKLSDLHKRLEGD